MGQSSIAEPDPAARFKRPRPIELPGPEPEVPDIHDEPPPPVAAAVEIAPSMPAAAATPPAAATAGWNRPSRLMTILLIAGAAVVLAGMAGISYVVRRPELLQLAAAKPDGAPRTAVAPSAVWLTSPNAPSAPAPATPALDARDAATPPSNPGGPNPAHPAVRPAPRPADIVAASAKIVASPMMGEEQVRVLDLVTATNALVAQMREQINGLSGRLKGQDDQIADLRNRLSLTEAQSALAIAKQAMAGRSLPARPSPSETAATVVQTNCAVRPVYVIASASPTWVTLRGAADTLIDLKRGSEIPCYGVIKSIEQEGANWVVKTDHDVIGR